MQISTSQSDPAITKAGDALPANLPRAEVRTRLQIMAIAGVGLPTVVADAILVNTVSASEARTWSVTGLSGFALLLIGIEVVPFAVEVRGGGRV